MRFLFNLSALVLIGIQVVGAARQPNITLIYTDDHGYADLSCQGIRDDIKTPHTDKLAAEGVRFTAGYCSAPQCRPSRAGSDDRSGGSVPGRVRSASAGRRSRPPTERGGES